MNHMATWRGYAIALVSGKSFCCHVCLNDAAAFLPCEEAAACRRTATPLSNKDPVFQAHAHNTPDCYPQFAL